MPTISSDSQSLSIDGRRIWLMSGSLHYARLPRGLWSHRLAAARSAGLNCIEVPVPWSRHEPRPGTFDFADENDLAGFIRMVGAAGMHCIVRAGPYIGDGYEMGGLPTWLIPTSGGALRSGAPEFLQACSRYIGALCGQIRDLQVSSPRKQNGAIVLLMSEYQWHCGDAQAGAAYLGEIDRFFRENGISVPVVGAHNLFHSVEGQIDSWTGRGDLHANMRQLRHVRPTQPRLLAGAAVGKPAVWGESAEPEDPMAAMRRVAQALAAGAQVNLSPFCAGGAFRLSAGRLEGAFRRGVETGFLATELHQGAPLTSAGESDETMRALRQVCTFASSFGRLFAALDDTYQPAVCSLGCDGQADLPAVKPRGSKAARDAATADSGGTAVECRGSQGSVVWVFAPCGGRGGASPALLTLNDGSKLPVPLSGRSVSWALVNTHLVHRATLDYCSLCAFALVGSVFVCFGPAGSTGMISINQSAFEAKPPDGDEATIEVHEGITVIICNERSIDTTWVGPGAVYLGAAGVDAEGQPIAISGRTITRVSETGEVTSPAQPRTSSGRGRVKQASFKSWTAAPATEYVHGTSDRYAVIDGPAEMQALGSPAGYGWLRLKLRSSTAQTIQAGFFEASDRLHLFVDGAARAIVGSGPGATADVLPLALRKGEQTITILLDNLGRGLRNGVQAEKKGLFGHILRVAPFKPGAPKLIAGEPQRLLSAQSPIMGIEDSDTTDARWLTWKFQHRRKTPLILVIDELPAHGLLLLNGATLGVLRAGESQRIVLRDDRLTRGGNVLQIALTADMDSAQRGLKASVRMLEGVEAVSEKAEWAYARWEAPPKNRFSATNADSNGAGTPVWWRGEFTVADTASPLYLEATGLSKGFLYLNGHEAGRYWTGAAKVRGSVPPQDRYYLPEPWLKVGEPNELLLFDEHGKSPQKCRLSR